MFIDRYQIHNITMLKNTTYLAHTHTLHMYCHVKMYQCTNLYEKKIGDSPNIYVHLICVKDITPPGRYFTK